jgi:CDP-paratose 2-epimerase
MEGNEVVVLDDLSRAGSENNLNWLQENHPKQILFEKVDVRNFKDLEGVIQRHSPLDLVYHFAAQVAVTTSVVDPRTDFEINAIGTFNLLEALRALEAPPILLYSSTNKVYGALEHIGVIEEETRYRFKGLPTGVPETMPMDFYSPYGCSKGTADQYVRDYHRIYGLPTIVFRNSCIYGPRQFGIEDQGWLAWFVIAVVLGKEITIYGNGKQVRDVLHVSDLIRAMSLAVENIDKTSGQVYNIGGGPENSISIWKEFQPLLADLHGEEIPVQYDTWRPGDQPVYISDIQKGESHFGWRPRIPTQEGMESLYAWVVDHQALLVSV